MQRLLEYVSSRAFEPSIASWKILLAAVAICPCLLTLKFMFISIARALTTNKEITPIAEQAATTAGQVPKLVERSEESSQILENIAQLDQRLTAIHETFKQAVSRDGLSGHRFTPENEQESSSHSLNAHTDLLPQTHSSTSYFHNARDVVCAGATFNSISGDYIMADANNENGRTMQGIVKGRCALDDKDLSLERLIYKAPGYRLHSARIKRSGERVVMKVYQGSHAKKVSSRLIQPNVVLPLHRSAVWQPPYS
ncbi:hypothetical protein BYT27DRAFT_6693578 [Phlegmacium glaucopus]|nr:hypothetical protein BYT27DRAFT_6693578 [Phlegmacium glaucopus]